MATISRKDLKAPDRFVTRSMALFDWIEKNRRQVLVAAAAVGLVVGGYALYDRLSTGQSERTSRALADVYAVVNAHVGAEPPPADPSGAAEPAGPTFATDEERLAAALRAYQRFLRKHGKDRLAPLARFGMAGILYDMRRYDDARREYERVADTLGREGFLAAQAIEGMGYSLEAKGDRRGALRKFDELTRMENGSYRDPGQYHQARMYEQLDETNRAREMYRALLDRLRQRSSDTHSPYLMQQTEARLGELDSSFVPGGEGPPGGLRLPIGSGLGGGAKKLTLPRGKLP